MKLVGLMLARNEDWILNLSLRVALEWCDDVVVLDHGSEDDTEAILAEVTDEVDTETRHRIHLLYSTADGWPEMRHRQMVLNRARQVGATHLAIIDADEALTANLLPTIRARIGELRPRQALALPMVPAWRGPTVRRVDPCIWTRAHITLAWADAPDIYWCQQTSGYEHHSRLPHGCGDVWQPEVEGGVIHYQFADFDRLRWKHRWYKMHEVVRYGGWKHIDEIDRQYSLALDERGLQLDDIPEAWWKPYQPRVTGMGIGREPWQKLACTRLLREHGPERFQGLNLWGWPE